MRLVLIIVALLLCTAGKNNFAAETRDLILVAGQSNAVGYDAQPSELPADVADEDILFWWRTGAPPPDEHDSNSGGKWTHLQPQPQGNPIHEFGNFANPQGGFGPEIGLARALYARGQRRIAIVKAAWSTTAMAWCWNAADPGNGGLCYRALVSETKAAIAAAAAQGITLRLRALVWVQGESDATPTAAPYYEKALADMIAALRNDLDSRQLIVLLAVNTNFGKNPYIPQIIGGKNPYIAQIIEAQQSLAAKDPRAVYVDTATATTANSAHFDSAGTLDIGRRLAQALLKIEANKGQ